MNQEEETDFEWVNELIAGFLLAGVVCVFLFIAFFFMGYVLARFGLI